MPLEERRLGGGGGRAMPRACKLSGSLWKRRYEEAWQSLVTLKDQEGQRKMELEETADAVPHI